MKWHWCNLLIAVEPLVSQCSPLLPKVLKHAVILGVRSVPEEENIFQRAGNSFPFFSSSSISLS